MNDLGLRIAELRKCRGVSRALLAGKAHLTVEALRKIEVGIVKDPGVSHVQEIAQCLGVSLDMLMAPTWKIDICIHEDIVKI